MNKILLNCTAATFTAVLISATVHAQTFGPAQNNPFGISTTGTFTSPTFVDLDGDADMDMFSGDADGNFYYFDNAGTVALAAFNPSIMNPFGLTDIGDNSYPTFADLDNDGDLDLMAGEQGAGFHYFENTGSAVAPAFGAAQFCPFGLTSLPTINSTVDLADLDNDGDQDMIAGEIIGNLYYFENTGTATVPSFTSPVTNPFGISPTGGNLTPSFTDLDGDGDFDILTGETLSDFYYFENTGTVSAASYASSTMNPFSLTAIGSYSTTTLADMNNDGLIDLMSGEASNGFYYFEQTNCTPPAAPTDATPAANLLICSGSTTTLSVTGTGTLGWYDASTGGTWLGGGSSFTTPVLSDTVTYYSQDSTCGESARTAITVIAYSPNVFVTGNDTICTGQTSNLTANGASTYVWTGGPSTAGISISPSSDTTLYVTGTDTNGCVNTDSVVVHIAVPMVYITGDDSICNGQSTTLMGNGAVTYSWFPGPTSASYTVNPVMDATYILTGADAYGCIGKDTLTVDVSPGLTVTVTGTTTICENESTTLTANASGANSYVWSSGPSTASYTVSPTTTTPYSVTAIDTISGCVGSTTITVTVNPLPDVSVFTLGSGATATNFTADSYLWVFCPIYIPAIGTNDTQFYLSVFTADYAVIITDNGCTDTSECVTLAAIGIDENIAAEDVFSVFPNPASMQINIKSNSAFTSVNITDVNGKLVISQESTTTTVTVNTAELQNGLYFVQLMNGSKPLSGAHKLVIEN